jgi:hypothetical protein
MSRKTRPEAFEHQLDDAQLAQLRDACLRSGFDAGVKMAAELWQIKTSVGALHRWYHKQDSDKILRTVARSAGIASAIQDEVAANPQDPLKACAHAIGSMALTVMAGQATREEMEMALEMFQAATDYQKETARTGQKEQELSLARDKFMQSVRTDIEKALASFYQFIKPHPQLAKAYKDFQTAVEEATTRK